MSDDKDYKSRLADLLLSSSNKNFLEVEKDIKKEEAEFHKKFKQEEQENAHKRKENFRKAAHIAVLVIMVIIACCITLSICVYAYHILTPTSLHFLDSNQISEIQKMLFGGAFSALLAEYVKKNIN